MRPGLSNVFNTSPLRFLADATANELGLLPVDRMAIYFIDSVPTEALYTLAQQFNVLGWTGWNLATTEAEQRELIKKAYLIHTYKGTVFGIKTALEILGFSNVEIREGVGVDYDGTYVHDGAITYAGGNWATFRVTLTVGPDFEITAQASQEVRAVIEAHKNARSHLIDITFRLSFEDQLQLEEILEIDNNDFTDRLAGGIRYDGEFNYGGSSTHNATFERGTFVIFVNNQVSEIYEF